MPIDPRIPLMGNAPQQFDILGTLGKIAHIKRMEAISKQEQQEMATKQRDEQVKQQFGMILRETQGDIEKAAPRMRQIDPIRATALEKLFAETKEAQTKVAKANLDSDMAKLDLLERRGAMVNNNDSYLELLATTKALGLPTEGMPPQYDPAYMDDLMSRTKLGIERAKALQSKFQHVNANIGGQDVIAAFDPSTGQVASTGVAAPQTDDARADRAQAETIRHNRTMEGQGATRLAQDRSNSPGGGAKPGDAQLVAAIIRNPGLYAGITPSTKERLIGPLMQAGFTGFAAGQTGKAPTGAQNRAVNFFNRAKQAADELDVLTEKGLSMFGQAWANNAPNWLQTKEGQAYNAAQRAFTEARLRKDSGAAIPPAEFENDRITYFRQTGDNDDTLAQKKRMRAAVLASLAYESGPALHGFYGDEAETILSGYKEAMVRPRAGGQQRNAENAAPKVGERRSFNGKIGEWDGKGWREVKQ